MSWKKPLLSIVAFAVALEVALQLGAIVVAWQKPEPQRGGEVLCIGDSFTFGIGATSADASYPGQLQSILRTTLPDVRVGNAGLSGHDSGDLIAELPSQWSAETRVLCVLVGINDGWRRPALGRIVDVAAGDDTADEVGFVWRWRTGGLLALLTRFEWNSWSRSGRDLKRDDVGGDGSAGVAAEHEVGFELLGQAGVIDATVRQVVYAVDQDGPAQQDVARFWQLMHARELPPALALARTMLEARPQSPSALALFVHAAVESGERETADLAVARLAALEQRAATPAVLENFAMALLWSGRPHEAIRVADRRVALEPLALSAWKTLQQAAFSLDHERTEPAMLASLRLIARDEPRVSGIIARNYARLLAQAGGAHTKIAALFVAATLLDGDLGETRLAARKIRPHVPKEEFERVIRGVGQQTPNLRAIEAVLDDVYAGEDATAWLATLRDHLTQIHAFVSAHDAKLVLLAYPFYSAELEAEQRAIAAHLGVPFVAVRERFDHELTTRPRSALFIPDGHCNDAGYRIVAELVAEIVAPLLRE